MPRYEYKVVVSPQRPKRVRGLRDAAARFALTIEEAINTSGVDGWEFMRSETLPCEHRGWFSRKTDEQTLLIFRRGKGGVEDHVSSVPPQAQVPSEPRLAADRSAPRRANFTSLRAAPVSDRDGDRT